MMFRIQYAFVILAFLLAGCGQKPEPTPEVTQTSAPPPLNITYCDINPSDLCLEGFDQDDEEQMLILLLADDRSFANVYVRAELDNEEYTFICSQSQTTLENVFCLGDVLPEEGETIVLNVHAKTNNKQIARGVFLVQYSGLQRPDVNFEATGTEASATPTNTPSSSYPNPTRKPSYPNPTPKPSYPNPTSTR